jgi:hypothetical protein
MVKSLQATCTLQNIDRLSDISYSSRSAVEFGSKGMMIQPIEILNKEKHGKIFTAVKP